MRFCGSVNLSIPIIFPDADVTYLKEGCVDRDTVGDVAILERSQDAIGGDIRQRGHVCFGGITPRRGFQHVKVDSDGMLLFARILVIG